MLHIHTQKIEKHTHVHTSMHACKQAHTNTHLDSIPRVDDNVYNNNVEGDWIGI